MKLAVGFILYEEATARYLADFLPSLETALGFLSPEDYEVFAFDNSVAGNDANRRALGEISGGLSPSGLLRRPIRYEAAGVNLGFSRAYNILIRRAAASRAKYFLIINPDTLLEPDSIAHLVSALDKDGAAASAAPKILRWNRAAGEKTAVVDSLGLVLGTALRFTDLGQGEEDSSDLETGRIIGPSGAAGLYRMSALEKVAYTTERENERVYFDERFFMYKEDCDLAYRLFLAGFRSVSVIGSVIFHDRTAASSGPGFKAILRDRKNKSRQVRAWSFRNQHLIYLKYWPKQNFVNRVAILVRLAFFLIFSLTLEQFLLKEYWFLWRASRGLTNIK